MALTFGKINRSAAFNPTTAFPLDARYYFETLADAEVAAQGAVEVGSSEGTYFFGENLVVVENGKATLYLIQPDKTLTEVGSVPVGDGKSIEVVDGVVAIKGFGSAVAGQQLRIGTSGEVEWFTPDTTTVEGLNSTVAGHTSDIAGLQESKANKEDVYSKEEIDGKFGGVFHYKGNVATYGELPADAEIGDVYNVQAADEANGVKAGDNVAWDGSAWDVLSGVFDLSAYAKNEAVEKKVDKADGYRLMAETEGDKLALIEEGAQVNVIDAVDTEQFGIDENKKLTLLDIAMGKVTGLPDALAKKVDAVDGYRLMSDAEGEKLGGIDAGAQVNILEAVSINGEDQPITNKKVNIPVGGDVLGVVKSATGDNNVAIAEDGTMSVPTVSVESLTQSEGEYLILNGGSSAN